MTGETAALWLYVRTLRIINAHWMTSAHTISIETSGDKDLNLILDLCSLPLSSVTVLFLQIKSETHQIQQNTIV